MVCTFSGQMLPVPDHSTSCETYCWEARGSQCPLGDAAVVAAGEVEEEVNVGADGDTGHHHHHYQNLRVSILSSRQKLRVMRQRTIR